MRQAKFLAVSLRTRWDDKSRRWYIGSAEERENFARWLPEDDPAEDREFTITSDHAYVAAATVPCQSCGTLIEVICIYCETGTVLDEPLSEFTVSNVRAVDRALAAQLAR